jgi:bla regulator protein blaR1
MNFLSHRPIHDAIATHESELLLFVGIAVIVLAAALASARSGRISAQGRHLILSLALLTPILGMLLAPLRLQMPQRPPAAAVVSGSVETTALLLQTGSPSEVACAVILLWAMVTFGLALAASRHWFHWARVARRAEPLNDSRIMSLFEGVAGRGRAPRLATSSDVTEPMVVGLLRPTVLLPAGHAALLAEDELGAVFTHELEHVRHFDNLKAVLHEIACAIFWWDPLHWAARRNVLELRERACDERVLQRGCARRPYVAALAKSCQAAIESPSVACMSGFHIQERIAAIMSYPSDRVRFVPEKRIRIFAAAAVLAVAGLMATLVPLPLFAVDRETQWNLRVRLQPGAAGQLLVNAAVFASDGELVVEHNAAAPGAQPLRFSTSRGDTTYAVTVTPNPGGGAIAALQVIRADTIIYASSSHVMPLTAPPAPPRPNAPSAAGDSAADAYLRVGGEVKAPKILSRVEPIYPEEARKARIAGLVILEARIDETGVVRDVQILKNMPLGLGEAAVEAVRQWTFAPAVRDGKAVPVIFNVTMNFQLDEEEKP